MSSHSPSHSSHGIGSSIKSFFTSSESYFASASPDTKRNPLTAVDAIAREVAVEWLTKSTTGYVANILNAAGAALKNLGWVALPENYRKHGIKTPFKWAWWAIANTGKAFANVFTGIPHAAHNVVQHGVNNTVIEATNGTTNRIPVIGNLLGNIPKLGAGIFNAPFTLASWVTKKIPDRFTDWISKPGLYQAPERHLVGSHAGWDHGHGGGHH
jgi:hypothetical protein